MSVKKIIFTSGSLRLLHSYAAILEKSLKSYNFKFSFVFLNCENKHLLTLYKSPHVNKRAKENFKYNDFSLILTFDASNNISFDLLSLLLLNKPSSISIEFFY